MDRALSSGPIVWFGIIVTTLVLLVIFQTVLWLIVPILLAIISYYVLSPLVAMAMSHGLTRSRSVLIVTAIDLDESRELAQKVGADGYMTKPYRPDDLIARIREIANKVWEKTHLEPDADPMRVRFVCSCGKKFKVSSTHRGKSLTCPQCGEPVAVPRV